jgi:hypothetical protein
LNVQLETRFRKLLILPAVLCLAGSIPEDAQAE